jgi:hypothetical protein
LYQFSSTTCSATKIAEYILQAIGAGATAKEDCDWADIWEQRDDGKAAIQATLAVKAEYALDTNQQDSNQDATDTYAVSWFSQYNAVQRRVFQIYWRSTDYIKAKVLPNVVAGLFLGFTFCEQDTSSTVQGSQNKSRPPQNHTVVIADS